MLREFNIAGRPAVEYEQEIMIDGKTSKDYELFHCADNKLYVFTAGWDEGPRPESVIRIVTSFRLIAIK
jgi:hypothetical protein